MNSYSFSLPDLIHTTGTFIYLLLFILFLWASKVPRTNPGAGWWALAVLSAAAARLSIVAFALVDVSFPSTVVYVAFVFLEKLALVVGVSKFFDVPIHRRWLFGTSCAAFLWALLQPLLTSIPSLHTSGFCFFNALALATVWIMIRRSKLDIPPTVRTAILIATILLFLHWLAYVPVSRLFYPPWRVYAYALGTILLVLQYLALLAAVFSLFHRRLLASEAEALDMAYRDPLTGLNNKRYMDVLFDKVLLLANRPHQTLAVCYIDLDKFKPINDSAGHKVGDAVLKEVAERLQGCLRSTDICARIGGDEFVVIATQLDQENQAIDVAEKMLNQFNTPIVVGKHSFDLGVSIGVSLYPKHGRELGDLLEKADAAMYEIKQQGRNGYRIHHE